MLLLSEFLGEGFILVRKTKEQLLQDNTTEFKQYRPNEEFPSEKWPIFGWKNASWVKMEEDFQEGDFFGVITSPDWTWRSLCGREYVVLVRGDEIIDSLTIRMN